MNIYKQRGAFLIEWSMAVPFYILCTFFMIAVCFWLSSISVSMFYLNEAARFASREIFNPDSTEYKQTPEVVFKDKMSKLSKSVPFLTDNSTYSTEYYNVLSDVISENSQEYDPDKTKIVSYNMKVGLNPFTSFFPLSITFKSRFFYSLNGNEDSGVLIK